MNRTLGVGVAVLLVSGSIACSSQGNPAAPAAASGIASTAIHTTNPCDHDTVAPTISGVSVSPGTLWPPNHKWWTVAVSYTLSDNCGAVTSSLSVTSNEPVNGLGDGNTSPDWQVVNNHTVRLRAERAGVGDGRVYTITITARDTAGNVTVATTQVTVVHDQGKKK